METPRRIQRATAAIGVLCTATTLLASGDVDPNAATDFFETHIRPLLVDECYSCHSREASNVRGDLLLDSKAGWEKGGSRGMPVIIPGDPEASLLLRAVRGVESDLAMPPKKKLSEEQISLLETWIRMGAPDPRTGEGHEAVPPDPAETHWAFQPVQDPPLPPVKDTGWVRNGIDRFILAKLEEHGLRPAPQADRRTLIRRATYVLTGLPPSPEEVAAFEADTSPEAFDRVVDRLLASPRYGERWGRHWLDIARYADTKGYVFEEERRYPYAYTYRDYVIGSFNDDKPYDHFLKEQIAADHLAEGRETPELAALGFLTLGRRFLNNQHDIIDDRIDVVTRGTMALTVACARCHDHKYDPIPTADYYSLYGVFASSEEPNEKPLLGIIPDPVGYEAFKAELAKREKERDDFISSKEEEHRRKLRESIGDYLLAAHDTSRADEDKREEIARSRQLSPRVVRSWMESLEQWREKPHPLFSAWIAFSVLPAEGFADAAVAVAEEIAANPEGHHAKVIAELFASNPPESLKDVAQRYNKLFAEGQDENVQEFLAARGTPIDLDGRELRRLFNVQESQRSRALQRAVDELHATHPGAPPRAMALLDRKQPVEPVVFRRGNPGNRGPEVPRQFLELLSGPERRPFSKGSGRLELAEAIVSPDNPLTARVAVNRVWLHHFGAGLARTPGDFGVRSDPPSHPELLDWLATRFVENGWSLKKLHRLILLSATWQQDSTASPEAIETDPDNRLLSHQNRRRLDFEAMRDTLLAAAGALDLTMGGHSVEITTRDYARRRTVYGFVERQNLPAMFRTFDFATPDTTSPQRFTTTVPQQALFFMNSPFSLDQARQLASRPEIAEAKNAVEMVERLYEIVFQRKPHYDELALGKRFLAHAEEEVPPEPLPPVWQYGYGKFDPESGKVEEFKPLPHFTGSAWQGGRRLPDDELGWLMLNATGGHPGGPRHGPVIRRWTAPSDAVVSIRGRLRHPNEAGDGVRGTVVGSHQGILGTWTVHNDTADTRVDQVNVRRGETIDFVIECLGDENSDSFEWAPRITALDLNEGRSSSGSPRWDARADFGGPVEMPKPLNRLERYAQVLLMTNEAAFVD